MPEDSVSSIFAEYRERLLKFIRSRVQILEDTEDILQEVFYQLARMDSLARPVEQTAAWLYRVARNKISNHYHKKKEEAFPVFYEEDGEVFEDIEEIIFSTASTPETEHLRALVLEEIQTALGELPEAQREVFEQTEFLGIPVKEIAEKTHTPVNTILARKHYAVRYLRKQLKNLYADMMGNI